MTLINQAVMPALVLKALGVKKPLVIVASSIAMVIVAVALVLLWCWEAGFAYFVGSLTAHVVVIASLIPNDSVSPVEAKGFEDLKGVID